MDYTLEIKVYNIKLNNISDLIMNIINNNYKIFKYIVIIYLI